MPDIIIAGSGPVGAMLALALRGCGATVLQVCTGSTSGERPIALSYGSRLLLEREEAWPAASPTAILQIHVSQQGGFGRTLLRADEFGLPALGYVAPYTGIVSWLSSAGAGQPRIDGKVVEWTPGEDDIEVRIGTSAGAKQTEHARLLVIADGSRTGSGESGRDYGQRAIVAEVQTERPHRNIAWERFTPEGPIALLPYLDRYALVWSAKEDAAQTLLGATDSEFLRELEAAFGRRLGSFLGVSARGSFPLALRHRETAPAPRVVLIGNAAQTLHPVAGQGMNLGLRDACDLAELIACSQVHEIGTASFQKRYAARRRMDRGGGIRFTDTLVRLFSNSSPMLTAARGAGLAALDLLPPARGFLARRMIYGIRALP